MNVGEREVQMDHHGQRAALDPTSATTTEELAALLHQLHMQNGARPVRDFDRWAKQQQGRGRNLSLSKSAVATLLAGKRLPSHATLTAFLEACGVDDDQMTHWLAARSRIDARNRTGRRSKQSTSEGDEPATPPSPEDLPLPWHRRFLAAWIGAGLLVAGSLAVALATGNDARHTSLPDITPTSKEPRSISPPSDFTSTIACEPRSCRTTKTELVMSGRSAGRIPPGRQALLMTRVDSTGRWYLGLTVGPISDGSWRQPVAIGNPQPQSKDRQFTICLYLLPTAEMDDLVDLFVSYRGKGLGEDELPAAREEVVCTAATRLAQ